MTWTSWVLGNALAATALALAVFILQRRVRNAALVHVAWGVVLLRLVTVPAFEWTVLPSWPVPSARTSSSWKGAAAIPPVLLAEMPVLSPFPDEAPAIVEPDAVVSGPLPALSGPVRGAAAPVSASSGVAGGHSFSPAELLSGIALAGTVVLLALAITRAVRFRRLLRVAAGVPPSLQSRADNIARELGLSRAPRLRLVPARIPPAVTAAPRAEILLPLPLLAKLSPPQLDALLAHELAHVRRGDPWLRPLELLIVALWWWHPVAWWAHRNFRAAEERACDDLVVRHRPGRARDYADALVNAAEFLARPRPPTPVLVTAFGVRHLKERLTMILDRNAARPTGRPWIVLGTAVLLAALIVAPSAPGDAATPENGPGTIEAVAPSAPEPPAPAPAPPATAPEVPPPAPAPPAPEAPPAGVPPVPERPLPLDPVEARIALERQIRELEIRQIELRARAEALDAQGQADQVRRHLAELRGQGHTEDAARLAEEVALHEAEAARQRVRMEAESRHLATQMEAELKLRELELRLQTLQEIAAPEKIEAMQKEMEKARRRMEEVELERMREELRRMNEELDARAAELDRAKSRTD